MQPRPSRADLAAPRSPAAARGSGVLGLARPLRVFPFSKCAFAHLFVPTLLLVLLPELFPALASLASEADTAPPAPAPHREVQAAAREGSSSPASATGSHAKLKGWKHGVSNRVVPVAQVEDVLVSSGGITRGGSPLYGEDARLRLGERYPAMAALLNLLSRGPFPAGNKLRSSMTRPMATAGLFVPMPFLFSAWVPPCSLGDCRGVRAPEQPRNGREGDGEQRDAAREGREGEAVAEREVREVQLKLVKRIVKREFDDAVRKVTREATATWQVGAWWADRPSNVGSAAERTPQQAASHFVQVSQGAFQALGSSHSFVYFFSVTTPRTLGRSKPTPVPAVLLTYDVDVRQTVAVELPSLSLGRVSPDVVGDLATQLMPRVSRAVDYFLQKAGASDPLPVIFVNFRRVDIQQTVDPWHGHPSRYLELQKEGKSPKANNFARLTPVPREEEAADGEDGRAFDRSLRHAVPIMVYRTTISAAAQAHIMDLISSADFAELAIMSIKDMRDRGPLFQPATHEYVTALKQDWEVYVTLAKTPSLIDDKQLAETHALLLRANENFSAERMRCVKQYVLSMSQDEPLFNFTKDFCYNFPEIRYPSSAGGSEFVSNSITAGLALRELFAFTEWPGRSTQETSDEAQVSGLPTTSPGLRGARLPEPRKRERSAGPEPRKTQPDRQVSSSQTPDSSEPVEGERGREAREVVRGEAAESGEANSGNGDIALHTEEGAHKVGEVSAPAPSDTDEAPPTSGVLSAAGHTAVAGDEQGSSQGDSEEQAEISERREEKRGEEEKGVTEDERSAESEWPNEKKQAAKTVATFHGMIPEAFARKMQETFGPRWISLLQLLGSVSLTKDYLKVMSWLTSGDSDAMMLSARRLLLRRDADVSVSLPAALRQQVASFYGGEIEGNLSHPVAHQYEPQYKWGEEGLKQFYTALVSYSSKK
ncbi:conserved hypothetical protein [Neospora caninum Liverpool]|uniref:Uncharacterized protein n=1 Tax=Neospora caninum (strain Liverpool) TaxID=572307 RepID=F0VPL0_NEOCL|nr:conserved hypothetical protein [Neospora caninum Liverpool]CBZ55657.1 conserved hypothetical protein [Neospora caninum Liverpool]|eukprot:XP_003885683.1 conserved hypothetical protein [Neospora caninum Liverpool]